MKKRNILLIATIPAVAAMISLSACGDGNSSSVAQLERQVDSLTQLSARQQGDLDDMQGFVYTLAEGLDTIAKMEHSLFFTNTGREGTIVSRDQLKANLTAFATTLADQRKKINSLTDSLKSRRGNIRELQALVDYMNRQLDEKDQMIAQLQKELQNKNADIAVLSKKLSALTEANTSLSQRVEQQDQEIKAQTDRSNAGYIVIGSAKMLKEYGVITKGGLFKRSKVNYDNLPRELFTKIDKRTFGGLEIPASKPKMISDVPDKSYQFVKTGKDQSELQLTDPSAFWSKTQYIVIQTN